MTKKFFFISCLSILAFSQGVEADIIGRCPSITSIKLQESELTFTLGTGGQKFTAAFDGPLENFVTCTYTDYNYEFSAKIPSKYQYSSCHFNDDPQQKTCSSTNTADCKINCDLKPH